MTRDDGPRLRTPSAMATGGAVSDARPAASPPNGPLLAADEAPAVEIVNADGAGSAVLVCDHASNRLPRRLGSLGLSAAHLADHIAWDPGAADVARRLSGLLAAPLILSGYSRLVIDCNRPLDCVESIPEQSDGVVVPGNRTLSAAERVQRVEALFQPYHCAIRALLDRRAARPSVLLSVHSFAPVLDGRRRPWSIGFAHGRDRRLAALFLDIMSRDAGLIVGDNDPYAVDEGIDHTIPEHGENRHIPHVLIEIRQDEVATPAGIARWAERLALVYRAIEPAAIRLCQSSR